MAHHILDLLRDFLAHYGYGAVALALLLENAGLPVPGETVLLLASFLAYSEHRLRLPYIIIVAIGAATLGDNLGFWIGHRGGRPLLEKYQHIFHVSRDTLLRAEKMFQRYGPPTVFLARFIFGLRVIAGPLAGVLRMHWKRFAIYNFLGATVWVTTISTVGYLFGRHWDTLMRIFRRLDVAIAVLSAVIIFLLWRQYRKRRSEENG
jgi:membrane-associated protein